MRLVTRTVRLAGLFVIAASVLATHSWTVGCPEFEGRRPYEPAEAVALYGGKVSVAEQDAGFEIFDHCANTISAVNLETGDTSLWSAAIP